jgi:sterol desaturase/sphingolipid hydroxylase (fatty acid hydroxylase superfamily)
MPTLFELDPITNLAIPFFALFVILEARLLRRRGERYPTGDALASIAMGIVSAGLAIAPKIVSYRALSFLYEHRLATLPTDAAWAWALLFMADDFSFYWHHRACHTVRLFWAGHVNHHSSTHYNLAVALRQAWGELVHKDVWWLWLPLVGFHPLMILTMMGVSLVGQFFLHTRVVDRLGPLEAVLNTPSHHRVHHASNVRYLDRNHGGLLVVWDRLFGTFEPEDPALPVVYGLTTNIRSLNPLVIATHEYAALVRDVRRAPRLADKLRYVVMPPGWSHDGRTKTTAQLRADEAALAA